MNMFISVLSCLLGVAVASLVLIQLRRRLKGEGRFRTLMELAPVAIWVNRDERIELVNGEGLRLLGAERAEQVAGRNPFDFFHPECHDRMRARLAAARSGQAVPGSEETIVRLDGALRQVEVASAGFADALGPAVQVVLRDITRRRQRDRELDKLHRALRALSKSNQALMRSETMDEPAYLAGICDIITQDCGHALVWIGFKEDDPERSIRPAAWAGFEEGYLQGLRLTWADAERGRGATGRAIRTGEPCMCLDTWTDPDFAPWRAEAIKRGYRSSLALPLLSGGKAFGVITFYSRERAAFGPGEVALLEELTVDLACGITSNRLRLEHAVAEAELREVNRRKDEFLATLAHELRNPLVPIRTGAFLLSQRPDQDPETRAVQDMIARQSAHMSRLVDDLLDVSRIEQGRLELRKEQVDPGLVAVHAVEACKALIEARGLRLTLDQSGSLPTLEADPVRLEQMLCNLLNNACKCTPAGGAIRLAITQEGAELVMRVQDDGMGMAPEVLAHVFDLFYQAGHSGADGGGLGIGLTLVRRLALLHGGTVLASSAGPGQGSEFTLRLPAPPAAPPSPAAAPADAHAGHRHVLVVDDDPHVRTTLEMLLKALKYRVTVASDGAKGVERAVALRPDIALIDLGMPGMGGLEAAARIRSELGQGIHLVALTGYSRDSDFAQTKAAGFDEHLVKSGDPRELLRRLSEIP